MIVTGRKFNNRNDDIDDQIDVVSRGLLGITVACARCHDHKYDAIPTEDYYSLAGIYFSSHILPRPGAKTAGSPVLRIPLASPAELDRRRQREERIAALKKEIEKITDDQISAIARETLPQTAAYLVAAWEFQRRTIASAQASGDSADEFASRRGLRGPLLERWLAWSGSCPACWAWCPKRSWPTRGRT